MELRLQPKPIVELGPADRGVVSNTHFFVRKVMEEIREHPCPVHLIRPCHPRVRLLYPSPSDETRLRFRADINREIQNPFIDDDSEEVFDRTPPACFLVVGKPGPAVSKVARQISEEFGSVWIDAEAIIGESVALGDDIGLFLDRVLRTGAGLTPNFVLCLISYRAHHANVRHRGYVLTGLPLLPLFHDKSVEQQLNYLFFWDVKPTVVVHVLYEDEDLVELRFRFRYEFDEKDVSLVVEPVVEEFVEPEEDELMPVVPVVYPLEPDIDVEPSVHRVATPKNETEQVWAELELFHYNIRPVLEILRARMDPQYFVTVDSRVGNEIEMIVAQLGLLPWTMRAPEAVPFIPLEPPEVIGEGEEEEEEELEEESDDFSVIIEMPPQEAFLFLFDKKTLSTKFRWELSHYNYVCPVALRAGEVVDGQSEFAVMYMRYIYFLSEKDALLKFIENPRPYILPIRPRPPSRFIVLGYPFSGKTSLAKELAMAYWVPYLNLDTILERDKRLKRKVYREFCRLKAEQREITRLTVQAWREWRAEEEERVDMLERWIAYMQCLLTKRIEMFYSPSVTSVSSEAAGPVASFQPSLPALRGEGDYLSGSEDVARGQLALYGMGLTDSDSSYDGDYTPSDGHSTVSTRIKRAMKHQDYDFDTAGLQVDAEALLSAIWANFSKPRGSYEKPKWDYNEPAEAMGESYFLSMYGEEGEWGGEVETESEESYTWANFLPPQSLSSFKIFGKVLTVREKRSTFGMMLILAAKIAWEPNPLQKEFFRWRLPCWLDIPLCEKFHDNPILLLHYLPDSLKERPPLPDPIDPDHPDVVAAGHKAFKKAGVVKIVHRKEEVALLLNHAIERAERNGMRCSGEVITPGGWVVDQMTLDQHVWDALAKEKNLPNYVYFLYDKEDEFKRILSHWYKMNHSPYQSLAGEGDEESSMEGQIPPGDGQEDISEKSDKSESSSEVSYHYSLDVLAQIKDCVTSVARGEADLDSTYQTLQKGGEDIFYQFYDALQGATSSTEVAKRLVPFQPSELTSSHALVKAKKLLLEMEHPLGAHLEVFSSVILQFFEKEEEDLPEVRLKESCGNLVDFYVGVLYIKHRLDEIKDWLVSKSKGHTIREIEIAGMTLEDVIKWVHEDLMSKFIKKPRELEEFEMDEVLEQFELDAKEAAGNEEEEEGVEEEGEGGGEARNDVRVFGEAGPFCVSCLDKGILLRGKPEIAIRYYGRLYFFWNEECKAECLANPEKFAPYYSAIRCLPPLRIWIAGSLGSGKSFLARELSNQLSINCFERLQHLNDRLLPNLSEKYIKVTSLYKSTHLSDSHNEVGKSLLGKFMKVPHTIRTFWLENPPYFPDDEDEQAEVMESIKVLENPGAAVKFPKLNFKPVELGSEDLDGNIIWAPLPEIDYPFPQPPFLALEEVEKALSNYISKGAKLPELCLEKTERFFWTKIPMITQGFVINDFPMRESDLEYQRANNWLPDLVLELVVSEEEAVERTLVWMMERWALKQEEEREEERLLENCLHSIQQVYINKRGKDLTDSKRQALMDILIEQKKLEAERKRLEEMEGEGWEEEEAEDRDMEELSLPEIPEEEEVRIQSEVDAVIKKEFPVMVLNANWEEEEQAKERFTKEISAVYQTDVAEVEKLKTQLEEEPSIKWLEVDGSKHKQRTLVDLSIQLDPWKKRENQRGEFAFPVEMDMAEALLRQGYYFLSKFGRWCPVQVYNMRNPINMFRPYGYKNKITPIVYRNYIYFVSGENEKTKFIKDPVKYTFNEPHHPIIPLRVAVIGPPKCGKSILSNRLASTFGLKVVTMGGALRFVFEHMAQSLLARRLDGYLRRGCFLPLGLKIEALVAALNDTRCVSQGFVFDGIPFDAAMSRSLAECGKLPFVILSLCGGPNFSKRNMRDLDRDVFRFKVKNRIDIDIRYKEWLPSYNHFAEWNKETFNNLYEKDAQAGQVEIFYWAYEVISRSFFAIQYYFEFCMTDRALPLQYLCVDIDEFELRKSCFHNNCPVCWALEGCLHPTDTAPPRCGLVQFLRFIYWVCPRHMPAFLASPRKFFPPHVPPCPALLPKPLPQKLFAESAEQLQIHGMGRCAVTRVDFPGVLEWEGDWKWAACYAEEVFLFRNNEMLARFLARPWRYHNADTIFEHIKVKSDIIVNMKPFSLATMPVMGYLEQTVGNIIMKTLQVVGRLRPIYPYLTPRCTGCNFVALSFKVFNAKNKTPHIERMFYDFMLTYCRSLRYDRPYPKPKRPQNEQPEVEVDPLTSSDSESDDSQVTIRSFKPSMSDMDLEQCLLDVEAQHDKLWSAKYVDPNCTEMLLTEDDELLEKRNPPKYKAYLKYQTYSLRSLPLPNIEPLVNFIYSRRDPLVLPKPFNHNTLYQPLPLFDLPYAADMVFNPEKEFSMKLFKATEPPDPSDLHVFDISTELMSALIVEPSLVPCGMDPELHFMLERFVPRFHLLDMLPPVTTPEIPLVVEDEYLVFNPHRDFTYLLIFQHFFPSSHYVRSLETKEASAELEYLHIISKPDGFCPIQTEFLLAPHITRSMRSRRSLESYQTIFEAACTFFIAERYSVPTAKDLVIELLGTIIDDLIETSPVTHTYILLLELLDEVYRSDSLIFTDSIDSHLNEGRLCIHEILPYPPLPLTLLTRPYYSLHTLPSMYKVPSGVTFVNQFRLSIVDGILNDCCRDNYQDYLEAGIPDLETSTPGPPCIPRVNPHICCKTPPIFYAAYDFLLLDWASIMPYPFEWSYNLDIKSNFCETNPTAHREASNVSSALDAVL